MVKAATCTASRGCMISFYGFQTKGEASGSYLSGTADPDAEVVGCQTPDYLTETEPCSFTHSIPVQGDAECHMTLPAEPFSRKLVSSTG